MCRGLREAEQVKRVAGTRCWRRRRVPRTSFGVALVVSDPGTARFFRRGASGQDGPYSYARRSFKGIDHYRGYFYEE